MVFVTPGKGKQCLVRFRDFLASHGGETGRIVEIVCDMSPALLAAIGETFEDAAVTVDWFHVVLLFTRAVDEVRKAEAEHNHMPKALRWAVLKAADGRLTDQQAAALAELEATDLFTATAWRTKDKLRWIPKAESVQAARWRITNFIRHARDYIGSEAILEPVRRALKTFEKHLERILQRWTPTHNNARIEGLNGLFQAARARARGYRNTATFMIYLIAAPLGNLFDAI